MTPQQKISKTFNSSKISEKYLTFAFGKITFTFGEVTFTFGEITFTFPKGPKIEKIQDRPPGLKISSGIEIFKRATRQSPIFVGNSEGPGLKISSEIENFKRD